MNYQPLFNLMSKEHNVILLESDMSEIIKVVREMLNPALILRDLEVKDRFVFPDDHLVDGEQFYEVISHHGINSYCLTPSGNRQYYNSGNQIERWSPTPPQEKDKQAHVGELEESGGSLANEWTSKWRELVKLILKGYYNRIAIQRPDIKTLLDWLEDDMNQVGMIDVEEQIQSLIHKK